MARYRHPGEEQIIKKAVEARREMGLSPDEPVDIFKILRDKENISIILERMIGNISGLFMRRGEVGLIVINTANTLGHQRFAAAHEYYHFKYEEGMTYRICPFIKYDDDYSVERDANIFASYFLMPQPGLDYYLRDRLVDRKKLNISDLIFLENHFMISHQFMLARIRQMGIISESKLGEMESGVIRKAKELGYTPEIYKPTPNKERIILSNYAEIAKDLLDQKLISFGKYESFMLEGGYERIIYGLDEEAEDAEATIGI
jgi:Zn-dependent peptidase ImmA (M78 family)